MPRRAKKRISTPEFMAALSEVHRAMVISHKVKRLSRHGTAGLNFEASHSALLDYLWHECGRVASTNTDRGFIIRFKYPLASKRAAESVYGALQYRNAY